MDKTTIAISRETKRRLDDRGSKGQTYDDIIIAVLDALAKRAAFFKRWNRK